MDRKIRTVVSHSQGRAALLYMVILFLALFVAISPAVEAAEADEALIDDALAGFDEDPSEGSDFDDALGGFGDEETTDSQSKEAPRPTDKKFYKINGSAAIKSSYNFAHDAPTDDGTDYRGLSRLRAELFLGVDLYLPSNWKGRVSGRAFYDTVYALSGEEYTDEVLDTYRSEAEIGEVWVLGSLTKNLDIKIGRQVLVLGKSDNFRVTDLLNPIDNREPGMVDIEDLRLPVLMTRLDYYFGDFDITFAAIHERRFNKNAAFGSDFWPFPYPPPEEEIPGNGLEETEFALSVNGRFSGWDLSLYYADIYNDQSYMEIIGMEKTSAGPKPIFVMKHARINMVGAALNVAIGNWLLKGETALFNGLKYANLPDETNSQFDLMGGVEYSGFTDTTLSFEAVQRTILDYDPAIAQRPDNAEEEDIQLTARYTGKFFRELITITALVSYYGWDLSGGGFERLQASYELSNQLKIVGGVMLYEEGDKAYLSSIGANDRVFCNLTYSF